MTSLTRLNNYHRSDRIASTSPCRGPRARHRCQHPAVRRGGGPAWPGRALTAAAGPRGTPGPAGAPSKHKYHQPPAKHSRRCQPCSHRRSADRLRCFAHPRSEPSPGPQAGAKSSSPAATISSTGTVATAQQRTAEAQ